MRRKGFTLPEALLATFISMYIFLGSYSIYLMVWKWWAETAPRIEAQRTARVTLARIVEGVNDSTVGTDAISSTTYRRRNGIAWAVATTFGTVKPELHQYTLSTDREIEFALTPDASNLRGFKIATVSGTTQALYWRGTSGTWTLVKGTSGITDLDFYWVQSNGTVYSHTDVVAEEEKNAIRVVVTVEKAVQGTRNTPYAIKVVYSEDVYLRNV